MRGGHVAAKEDVCSDVHRPPTSPNDESNYNIRVSYMRAHKLIYCGATSLTKLIDVPFSATVGVCVHHIQRRHFSWFFLNLAQAHASSSLN